MPMIFTHFYLRPNNSKQPENNMRYAKTLKLFPVLLLKDVRK